MSAVVTRAAKRAKAESTQRRAAAPDDSVWVAASAGTGKTKVLTDRVLSLMLHGTAPGRILCLTFTKAAAAEMANRLADRLAGWVSADAVELAVELKALLGQQPDEATLTTARRLFARVLDVSGGMKIQTIHAFCQSLLGRFPLEAGVPPHFQVLDQQSAGEMLEQAREEVLARTGDDADLREALATVTTYAQEGAFTELVAELTRQRSRLAHLRRSWGGGDAMVGHVFRTLGVDPQDSEAEELKAACDDSVLDLMGLRLAMQALAKGGKTDQRRGEVVAAWLADPTARVSRFQDYLGAFFTEGGDGDRFKTLAHKQALAESPGVDEILASEAARLELVRARLRALAVARATVALLRIGDAILLAYERHKRARALLDYDDLILETRDLLRRAGVASWVLFKLDGGLDHILIDEAQDTSPDQWEVIEALTSEFFVGEGQRDYPRTVFAVGDAKQSIFSFQRADPAAFADMRATFSAKAADVHHRLQRIDLDVSFRSTVAVLQAVDCVFSAVQANDGVLFDEAEVRHDPLRVGQAGRVELWPPISPDAGATLEPWAPPVLAASPDDSPASAAQTLPPRARLARLIARKIWYWTRAAAGADDPECWLDSKARRLAPGDVLVLVRRRNEFVEELVRELKQLEVPVAGVDRMVLTEQLSVMDLIALGRVLLLPEDDLTLACVLKGPFLGLSEEQLFALAYRRAGSLWDELRRRQNEEAAFAQAYHFLSALQARADFLRPFELYGLLLGPLRGRERLLARLGPDAGDPIDEFLNLALAYERENVPSLEGFLHWIEVAAQEVKRDLEHGQDVVRVMTVHGAKGLQAPVVFLPDTMQLPPAPRGLLWVDSDDGRAARQDGLPIWPLKQGYDGPSASRARAAARLARAQEYRRLLYVAMTRAEDRLYVAGWHGGTAVPEDCWYKLIEAGLKATAEPVEFDFRGVLAEGWSGPGWRLRRPQDNPPEAESPPADPFKMELLPDWARVAPAAEPRPPRPLAPSRPSGVEPAVRSPLGPDDGYRFQRGRLVHRLLQSLPDLPAESRATSARRYLAQPLHELDVAQQRDILEETLAVLDHPDFAPLFSPASRAEVPIVGLVEGRDGQVQVVSGQVDRLVATTDELLIVDYKTNRPAPQRDTDVPVLYLQQLASYRAVLAQVYPDRPVHCLLLWTDGPRLMQISNALLEGHQP